MQRQANLDISAPDMKKKSNPDLVGGKYARILLFKSKSHYYIKKLILLVIRP